MLCRLRALQLLILTLVSAGGLCADDLRLPAVRKRLILTGWEFNALTPRNMKDIVSTLGDKPVDGVSIGFKVPSDRKDSFCTYSTVMHEASWKKEWFADDIALMKAGRSDRLPDNFLLVWISPTTDTDPARTRLPWNDDARWKAFANNMGVLAYAAKQGGFRGLVIDPEDYHKARQYVLQPSDGDYESASRLARRRGRQVMDAVAREYPDITILAYWLLSISQKCCRSADPAATVEAQGDLWVPFVNGMLDSLPPSAKLIDATESGYMYQGDDFVHASNMIRNQCLSLVAPENRTKYRAQVLAGFGLYADTCANPETTYWYMPPLSGSRAKRLARNLTDALTAADEYIWLYGEKGCWKRWRPEMDYEPWEEVIPGYETAIGLAKDPDGMGGRMLENLRIRGDAKNLAMNPGFEQTSAKDLPAGWDMWQHSSSKGAYLRDAGGGPAGACALATGPTNGCFIQTFLVTPGDVYAIGASSRLTGAGRAFLLARWQDANGRWMLEQEDSYIYFPDGSDEWKNAMGVVRVPDGVAKLVLLLSADLPRAEDQCRFDNVEIYKLW